MRELIDKQNVHYGFVLGLSQIEEGVHFLTSVDKELQCATMVHPRNHEIKRHFHPKQNRKLTRTTECLLLMSGILEVKIYNDSQEEIAFSEVEGPALIILFEGGHGFVAKTDISMIEIKQGPFTPELDKVHF